MPSKNQTFGTFGEKKVCKYIVCPKCKRGKTLRLLRQNFVCADVICDFCGYLAQVKAKTKRNIDTLPSTVPGAAWAPAKVRMDSGIYFPLFIVLVDGKRFSIFYLSADLQTPALFVPRKKPLSSKAKRAGWHGFDYDLRNVPEGSIVRML